MGYPQILFPIAVVLYVLLFGIVDSIYKLKPDERLVVFRLGKPIDVRGPGWVMLLPFVESGIKYNSRDESEARMIINYQMRVRH